MKEEKEEPKIESVDGPEIEVGEEPRSEVADQPRSDTDRGSEPEGDQQAPVGDGLELDRMEVKQAVEMQEEQEEGGEPEIVESAAPEQTESARRNVLVLVADYWIWMVAFLLGLTAVSAALWVVLNYSGGAEAEKSEVSVHAVTASLGGEHYVRFKLLGPFRDSEGRALLRRCMPKIKNDLILSGGQPEVTKSIAVDDLSFLRRHVLGIISNATGIPVGELDVKGLSLTLYSDEAEVEREG